MIIYRVPWADFRLFNWCRPYTNSGFDWFFRGSYVTGQVDASDDRFDASVNWLNASAGLFYLYLINEMHLQGRVRLRLIGERGIQVSLLPVPVSDRLSPTGFKCYPIGLMVQLVGFWRYRKSRSHLQPGKWRNRSVWWYNRCQKEGAWKRVR